MYRIKAGTWIRCLVQIRSNETDKSGRLFFMEVLLQQNWVNMWLISWDVLYKIKTSSEAMSNQVEVADDYGMIRSCSRRSTA